MDAVLEPPWLEAGTEAALASRRGRMLAIVEGRHLAIIEHGGEVYAMDATCYHMGGPLVHADIEDCGDFGPCVVCPWHRYQISLRTGDGLYQNMAGKQCAKGVKQRVHPMVRRDGKLLVQLQTEGKIESDTYAFKPPPPSGGGGAPPPKGRSGDVMKRQAGAASGSRVAGHSLLRGAGPPGAAGVRGMAPPPAGVSGDVARSMSGADGRAPWARAGPPPPPPPPGCASFGAAQAAGLMGPPAAGSRAAAAEPGWLRCVVLGSAPAGRNTVALSVVGELPVDPAEPAEVPRPFGAAASSAASAAAAGSGAARGGGAATYSRGSHVMVRLEASGSGEGAPPAERPYTPYDCVGSGEAPAGGAAAAGAPRFSLLVKAYEGGALSPRLAALRAGGEFYVKGPLGGAPPLPSELTALGLVCGGTGITPMLQLLVQVLRRAAPPPVRLLCFNREAEDLLLRPQLGALAAAHPALRVTHFLSAGVAPPGWDGELGRPSQSALETHLPPAVAGTRVFWCGPPPFNELVRALLGQIGFTDEMSHEFS
jgi:NAD(P)H-flavin reductase/nitrite reductase/ring-hydroxylating ferredoxin subunit